ncbi:hypothetical protein CRM22_000111 [Opisthorchis felineus]|uniref:Uncharacterized protein n=1 Tax=Opisthorchis felineus TaxID=147828 RepID=A0A4S2MNJ9_OPIFE|nr:hypothetical protein CRM22_000111 [Opisthorchis felineus]
MRIAQGVGNHGCNTTLHETLPGMVFLKQLWWETTGLNILTYFREFSEASNVRKYPPVELTQRTFYMKDLRALFCKMHNQGGIPFVKNVNLQGYTLCSVILHGHLPNSSVLV